MYIEFPQYIRSGKNVDKQQKIVNNTSQYPFAKAGGYLTSFGCKYIIILLLLLPVSDKTYPESNRLDKRG